MAILIWSSPYLVAIVLLEHLLSLGFVSYYSWKMKVVSLLFQHKSWILFFRSGFLLSLLGFHFFTSLTMIASLYFSTIGQWEPRISDTICNLIISFASIFVCLFLVTAAMFVVQFIKSTHTFMENQQQSSKGLGWFIHNDSLQYTIAVSVSAFVIVYTIVIDIVYLKINNNPRVCWFLINNFAILFIGSLTEMIFSYGILYILQIQKGVGSDAVLSGSDKTKNMANGMQRLLITLGMGVSMMISIQLLQIIENVLAWDYYFSNNLYEDTIYRGIDLQLMHFGASLSGMISTIAFMKFIDKRLKSGSSKSKRDIIK
jgi:hypothetical protein